MKNGSLLLLFFVFLCSIVCAQEKKYEYYGVGFYNLENLFDTIHDNGKNDYEFLPEGKYKWGTLKYTNKIKNISMVLNDMGTDVTDAGMAIVGVCEVENKRVLEDLVRHDNLAHRGWRFLHIEGPDKRGIDCALLYNPKMFNPLSCKLIPDISVEKNDAAYNTRAYLVVSGEMGGEMLHIIVNHWPSRSAKSFVRERAGMFVRQLKDSLMNVMPNSKVIVMGDMNDNPEDKSMAVSLGALRDKESVKKPSDLYNPCWDMLDKKGVGTLNYNGKWQIYDQIVFSGNMLGGNRYALKFHAAEIFLRDYLLQHEGRFKGSIKRTHAGGVWLDGYSDHFPMIVYLFRQVL